MNDILNQESIIMEHTLIMTVGLPRSGKSTWTRLQNLPIVNPDSIRLGLHGQRFIGQMEPYVWAIAQTMLRALFLAGHEKVILDATNTTKARREAWVSKDWITLYKVVPTTVEECIRRAGDDTIMVEVINRMATQFEPLDPEEECRIYLD
jgi:predicted kinase